MRLDYTLYILATLLFVITVIPFVATIEGVESDTRSLWVVTTVVLGLLSIGLGYSQRPKTEAQACQTTITTTQEAMTQTQPATTVEETKKGKTAAPIKQTTVEKAATVATAAVPVMVLTQVKGIGEKRATQLKALGINSVEDLSKASAKTVAKKLKISPKIVGNWIANAKELVK
ncbi:helix-hairpin-helix domain-containing protein [Candidatus Bathyarchaeota archaeon]|nr:helix-hairpin-helix domain-containing protein [Candidatus Bathyarchaeota archaeon]